MAQLNTSVLVGDKIYPAGSELPAELVDQVDSDDVFVGGRPGKAKKSKKEAEAPEADFPEGEPSTDWNVAQLTAYAVSKGVDLGDDKKTKAEIVSELEAAAIAADAANEDN